jgi:C-terminal processing protease CtpA/Prc
MKNLPYSLASLGVMLLMVGSVPVTLSGQSQTQNQTPAVAPSGSADACLNSKSLMEQLKDSARINDQELQEQVSNLQKMAKEVEMNSPELAKLQGLSARIAGNQDQWEARAQELASRAAHLAAGAQEKAAEVWGQEPRVFTTTTDDGSGWLGVEIGEVTAEKAKDLKLAEARGVEVIDVEPDGPAAKAGLKEQDVITRYDGQVVEGTVQFRRLVRETPSGRNISLAISRNGSTQDISVELGDRSSFYQKKMKGKMRDFGNAYAFTEPNFDFHFDTPGVFGEMDGRAPVLGISAEDLSGQLGTYFGAPNGTGILVREVRSGTAAEKAGLKAGDVIVKVNGNPVGSLSELRQQLRDKSEEKTVSLGILRKGSEMNVPVTIEKPKPMESTHLVRRAQL